MARPTLAVASAKLYRAPPQSMESEHSTTGDRNAIARDAELVRRVLAGEAEARDEFGSRLESVRRIAAWLDRRNARPLPEDELRDVVQNSTLTLWRKLPALEGRATIETWAYKVTRFELMNERRRHNRRATRETQDLDGTDVADTRDDDAWHEEDRPRVIRALGQLDADKRRVIEMKHFGCLTFERIADELNIHQNTARTRYYRGLKSMRESVELQQLQDVGGRKRDGA